MCIGLGLPACTLCGLALPPHCCLHHRHRKEIMFCFWASLPCTALVKKDASERLVELPTDCPGLLLSLQIQLRTVWRTLPSMANEEDDPVIQEVSAAVNSPLDPRRRTNPFCISIGQARACDLGTLTLTTLVPSGL